MRQEQTIATVARVVITTIREMEAVVLFVRAAALHLWLRRMPLGMSGHPRSLSDLPHRGMPGRGYLGNPGSKRSNLLAMQTLALASCPAGTDLG